MFLLFVELLFALFFVSVGVVWFGGLVFFHIVLCDVMVVAVWRVGGLVGRCDACCASVYLSACLFAWLLACLRWSLVCLVCLLAWKVEWSDSCMWIVFCFFGGVVLVLGVWVCCYVLCLIVTVVLRVCAWAFVNVCVCVGEWLF